MTNYILDNDCPNYISFATECCIEGKKKWYKTLNKHKYYFEILINRVNANGEYYFCNFELENLLIEDAIKRNDSNYKQLRKDIKKIQAFLK